MHPKNKAKQLFITMNFKILCTVYIYVVQLVLSLEKLSIKPRNCQALVQTLSSRLGRFEKPCIIQLFLGRYLIDIHEKLHSSPQNSKTRAGAGLENINMDQSETRSDMPGL